MRGSAWCGVYKWDPCMLAWRFGDKEVAMSGAEKRGEENEEKGTEHGVGRARSCWDAGFVGRSRGEREGFFFEARRSAPRGVCVKIDWVGCVQVCFFVGKSGGRGDGLNMWVQKGMAAVHFFSVEATDGVVRRAATSGGACSKQKTINRHARMFFGTNSIESCMPIRSSNIYETRSCYRGVSVRRDDDKRWK